MIAPVAKVAHLLSLAEAGAPNERELAASRAADLMQRFSITEADVAKARETEVTRRLGVPDTAFFHEHLAIACARSRACRVLILPDKAIAIRGPKRAADDATKLYENLVAECDRARDVTVEVAGKWSPLRKLSTVWRERFNHGFLGAILARLSPLYPKEEPKNESYDENRNAAARVRAAMADFLNRSADEFIAANLPAETAEEVYARAYADGESLGARMQIGKWPPPPPPPERIPMARWLPEWVPSKFGEIDTVTAAPTPPEPTVTSGGRFGNLDWRKR